MKQIQLKQVSKSFGDVEVIPPLDLEIEDGEFVVFVGPSGCGKSTLLRLIAGLEDVTSGQVLIDGADATAIPPARRGLAMVFQSYALYPHMSVRKNIAFPLRMAGLDKAEQERRVEEAAKVLNLTEYLHRRPGQLSGGQRQRVAIGLEISELHKRLSTTMIYVTHDQVEAMTMADKIVVLQNGVIEQVGSPLELYHNPRNTFVAGFIGSPRMNLVDGAEAARHNAHTIGIRPENITISTKTGDWEGVVGVSEHLGSDTYFHVNCPGFAEPLTMRAGGAMELAYGSTVFLTPDLAYLHRFDENGLRLT
jgi:multiple sugar transport system ATP-binding protein